MESFVSFIIQFFAFLFYLYFLSERKDNPFFSECRGNCNLPKNNRSPVMTNSVVASTI